MKKYGEYKTTDQVWLQKIPKQWDMMKIKYEFTEISDKNHADEVPLVASQHMGVVPKTLYGQRTVEATKGLELFKRVKVGDFVISLRSFQGGLEYAYYQGIISPAYTILRCNNPEYNQYYRLLFKSAVFIKLLTLCVTGIREGQNIDYSTLRCFSIPVPPRHEQDQIVRFLDYKTAKIDKLISGYKRQIELLEERKLTVIDEIVHRGINPSSPKKNSNVDYIGDIPEHWLVLQNHRLYKSMNRKFSEKETVLSLSQKDGLIPYEQMTERSLHTASYDNWQLVLPNDLVLNRFKAHLGVFFSSQYRGISTFHYGVYEPKMQLVSKYYEALYHTAEYRRVYAGQSKGMTVGLQNLSDIDFFTVYTVYPPYEEQKAIVSEIEKIEQQFLNAKSHIEHQIELLQEYRTRLISDVVTGQVDVRDEAIPETEVN